MGDIVTAEFNLNLPERQRMSDVVSAELFRMIVALQVKPGTILNENALMAHLSCGRTPLREALILLEKQHLIRVVPRQATIVTELTIDAAAEIYEALRYVEGPLGRLAAERNTLAQLHEMEELTQRLESIETARGLAPAALFRLADGDFDFHLQVAQAARNTYLLSTLEGLRGPAMRLLCLDYRLHEDGIIPEIAAEHRAVLTALKDRNPDAAEQAIQAHADAGKRRRFQAASDRL